METERPCASIEWDIINEVNVTKEDGDESALSATIPNVIPCECHTDDRPTTCDRATVCMCNSNVVKDILKWDIDLTSAYAELPHFHLETG